MTDAAASMFTITPTSHTSLVTQQCRLCATTWTQEAPLSMGILQARILEWTAMPSNRGSFQHRDQTRVSPNCRRILYCLSHHGSPAPTLLTPIQAFQISEGVSALLTLSLLFPPFFLHHLNPQQISPHRTQHSNSSRFLEFFFHLPSRRW